MSTLSIDSEVLNWDDSPCRTCRSTPCCRFLPITTVDPDTRADLEAMTELLRLRYLELGLREDGTWSVFYGRPCSFLDEESGACTVHGTGRQPPVCIAYNAKTCWYREAFARSESLGFVRFNFQRMQWFIEHTLFDDHDAIYRIPRWDTLVDWCGGEPLSLPTRASEQQTSGRRLELRVPPGAPVKPRDWELVQFREAFPGVTLVDSDGVAAFALETEVAIDPPRLPTRLPAGITLIPLSRGGQKRRPTSSRRRGA